LNYNNVLYGVAGEAAANVAGMSYPDLIMAKLLKPLGLMSAGLSHPEMAKQPNFAMPYEAASFEDAKNGIFEEGYIDEIHMPDAPAGDIFMNVVDLAKWGRVILKEGELNGKQVLNKESVQETLKSQSIDNDDPRRTGFAPTVGYGLGWSLDSFKGHTCFRHGTPPFTIFLMLSCITRTLSVSKQIDLYHFFFGKYNRRIEPRVPIALGLVP
jgi:CubicO group peptidase (beta-lactamase class C family)